MDELKKNKYFLFIGLDKIKFVALNETNKIFYNRIITVDNSKSDENFDNLKIFLEKNIIEIEKNLKNYVKDIILIIDGQNFLTIDMSSIYNFKNHFNQNNDISNLFVDLKNDLKKYMMHYEIIHMIINKYIIGEKSYFLVPKELHHENIFLEIRFICLKIDICQKLKSFFTKYQITIKNVLSYEYVNSFKKSTQDNIYDIADKLLNGLNQNEILFTNKTLKNKGFFEKFFDFFG